MSRPVVNALNTMREKLESDTLRDSLRTQYQKGLNSRITGETKQQAEIEVKTKSTSKRKSQPISQLMTGCHSYGMYIQIVYITYDYHTCF